MIDRIDHLVLTVRSLDNTLDFYERAFGMRRKMEPGQPAALLFGRHKINVHQLDHGFAPKAALPTAGAGDLCLIAVEPLDRVRAHLERLGIAIEEGPVARVGALGAMTSLYLRDPDGNLVEISAYDTSEGRS